MNSPDQDDAGRHDRLAELLNRLHGEADERERLHIGGRIARLDPDHPVLAAFGERRILFWCDLKPVVGARLLPGLTAADAWVRRSTAETLLDAGLETEAVTACLLNEVQQATDVGDLYDDRHHEIHDAAWGLQFEWLRERWPWYLKGLVRLEVEGPEAWLESESIAVRLNSARLRSNDGRAVSIVRACLHEYSWLEPSFWTFIAACELLNHMDGDAHAAMPELRAVLDHAPKESLPRLLAGAIVGRIQSWSAERTADRDNR